MKKYRKEIFPIIIKQAIPMIKICPIRSSWKIGSCQVIKRMMEGKPVIVQGYGISSSIITHNSDFAKDFVGLIGNIHHALGEFFILP